MRGEWGQKWQKKEGHQYREKWDEKGERRHDEIEKTEYGFTEERVGVIGWRKRKRRRGLGFSEKGIRGERRSGDRSGREGVG